MRWPGLHRPRGRGRQVAAVSPVLGTCHRTRGQAREPDGPLPGHLRRRHVERGCPGARHADFIFCATDTMASRRSVNIVAQQYSVPAVQLGTKVPVSRDGEAGIVHLVVRPITVVPGCLDCAGAISQRLLHNESLRRKERECHRYIDDPDVPEPSVITLNMEVVGRAVTDLLFMVCGPAPPRHFDASRDVRAARA